MCTSQLDEAAGNRTGCLQCECKGPKTEPQTRNGSLEMSVQLDHLLVPSKDKNAAAKLLGGLLGVRWEPSGEGPAPDLNQPPLVLLG
jgi:hypothetical protein